MENIEAHTSMINEDINRPYKEGHCENHVRIKQGKYHGGESRFLSEYALPPLSTPFYKKYLGHAVSIYLDPISPSTKHEDRREHA